jgi:UDP-2,3-diacylglucosamine hydrolase
LQNGLQAIICNHIPNLGVTTNKKIYFASDQHFGAPAELSFPREQKIVAWLDEVNKMPKLFFY